MCKFDHTRRQFLRTASLTSMAGFYASPFLLGLNSLAAMAQGSGFNDYRALGGTPVRAGQIFGAKLAALLAVATGTMILIDFAPCLGFPALSGAAMTVTAR